MIPTFSALARLSKLYRYPDDKFGLFRVIGFQFQNAPVGSRLPGNAREMDPEVFPWFKLFYSVGHFTSEGTLTLLECQGFVHTSFDSNCFG